MLVTVFEMLGLGAALVGALALVRGDWETTTGCFAALVVVSFLAAVWTE